MLTFCYLQTLCETGYSYPLETFRTENHNSGMTPLTRQVVSGADWRYARGHLD